MKENKNHLKDKSQLFHSTEKEFKVGFYKR